MMLTEVFAGTLQCLSQFLRHYLQIILMAHFVKGKARLEWITALLHIMNAC